jgi:hypothetical protein
MRAPLRHAVRLFPALLLLAACERASNALPDSVDTTGVESDSSALGSANPGWNADAGPMLLVASDVPGVAEVIFPEVTDSTLGDSTLIDLAPVRGARVELFSRRGDAGRALVVGEDTTAESDSADEESCDAWPLVRLRAEGGPSGTWTAGLIASRARAIALDSIEGLSRADSSRLARDVARLAAALPDDTARAFRGLPYFVRTVRRFRPAPGLEALVADVSRRINQEANPREEQILLVAERDSGSTAWTVGFSDRASGQEGSVETHDVLAVVTVGDARRPTIILGRYVGDGISYSLLERIGPREWRVRWTSATSGC